MSTTTADPAVNTPQFPGELLMVPVGELHESPRNPRKYFAEGPLAELAESIRVSGVRVPLSARPRLEGGGYEIGAGHRRYRAAKRADVTHVPVLVSDLSDAEFLKVLTFDNAQREDVHPLEEAQGYRTYIDEALADVAAVAAEVGKSPSYVYGRLKLLDLSIDSQKAFWDGKIKAAHAEKIARLSPRDQALAIRAIEPPEWNPGAGPMSVRDLQEWIAKNLHLDLCSAPFAISAAALRPEAGDCGDCPHRLGNAPDFDAVEDLPYMCTRRECYEQKVAAHIEQRLQSGEALVLLSEMPNPRSSGLIPRGDWTELPGGRNTAGKLALIVEGPRAGFEIRAQIQERIPPAPPKPAAPAPVAPPAPAAPAVSKEEKARLKAAQQERERIEQQEHAEWLREQETLRAEQEKRLAAEKTLRREIASELLAKVKWPPRREDVLALLPSEGLSELPDALAPTVEEFFGGAKFVIPAELSPDDAARLVVLFSISNSFDDYAFGHSADELHAAAKRYNVDVAKIRDKAKEAEGGTRRAVLKKLPVLGERMSLRAYARHRGCALNAVQKAIKSGRIERSADGLIDAAAADRAWDAKKAPVKKSGGKKK
jgi:ParB family transcriptional regulator, chromosome partitioning protein